MYWWCDLWAGTQPADHNTILPLSVIFIEYDLEMIKVWQKQSWDKQGQVIIVLPPPPLMFGNNKENHCE